MPVEFQNIPIRRTNQHCVEDVAKMRRGVQGFEAWKYVDMIVYTTFYYRFGYTKAPRTARTRMFSFFLNLVVNYHEIVQHPTFDFVGREMSETRNDEVASGSIPKALSTRGWTDRAALFRQIFGCKFNALPDWQPMQFIANGNRDPLNFAMFTTKPATKFIADCSQSRIRVRSVKC